jgi:hypothetical protein
VNAFDVTASKATSFTLNVADKMAYNGQISAAKATSVTAAITGHTDANAQITAAKATSVVISEVANSSELTLTTKGAKQVQVTNAKALEIKSASDLSGVESFSSSGAGDLTGGFGLTALSTATISNVGTVTLGALGSNTQDFALTLNATGSKALTTGAINTKDQAITINATSLLGDAHVNGNINAISGDVTITAAGTGEIELDGVTGKNISLNFVDSLGGTDFDGDINAAGNVTIVGANLKNNDLDGTGAGKIVLTGAANSTQTVSLTGGILDDTFLINTATKKQTVNVTGDLGIATTNDTVVIAGNTDAQTISVAGLSGYETATIDGGAGADVLTGGAGDDVFQFANEGTSDSVSGFTVGAGNDQLEIDVSEFNSDNLSASEGTKLSAAAGVGFIDYTVGTAASADSSGLTILRVTNTTGIDAIADVNTALGNHNLTLDAGGTDFGNGEGLVTIFYDADDAKMVVGYLEDSASGTGNGVFDGAGSTFVEIASVSMTAADYGNLHTDNFDFI